LGEGDAGWADVMKALDEIGYKGYGIAEVPWRRRSEAEVPR
jgi:sugar phosphate isomerase/epimerase